MCSSNFNSYSNVLCYNIGKCNLAFGGKLNLLLYMKVARIHALLLSILPIISSYLYAKYNYQSLNIKPFIFVASSAVLFHLATNTISEFRDFKNGVDDPNSKGADYRLVKINNINPKNILYIGVSSFFMASVLGVLAVIFSGVEILIAGLFGAFISLFYSEWPFGYKYKAMGELAVFFAYGPLITYSCVFSLSSNFSVNDFLFSIPFGLLITAVLMANNIRDYDFDRLKIKTLATVLGLRLTYILIFSIVHIAFLIIPILIYKGALPKACFSVFLSYTILFLSIKLIKTERFIDVFGMLLFAFCVILQFSILLSL